MAQKLRTFTALPEDSSQVHHLCQAAHNNPALEDVISFPGLCGYCTHMHKQTHSELLQNTAVFRKIIFCVKDTVIHW